MASPERSLTPDMLHYLHKENTTQVHLATALAVCVSIAMAARVYSKAVILKNFGADDIVMSFAYLLYIACLACMFYFEFLGNRFAAGDFRLINVPQTVTMTFNSVYASCTICCKISIAIFMLRIFEVQKFWHKFTIYGLTIFSTILGILFFASAFTCGTVSITVSSTASNCKFFSAARNISITWGVANTTTDIGFAALCFLLTWSVLTGMRTRIIASTLLSFGSLAAVASVLRVVACFEPNLARRKYLVGRYSLLEAGVCIAAASLATTRPLFRLIVTKAKTITKKSTSSSMTDRSTGKQDQDSTSKGPMTIVLQQIMVSDTETFDTDMEKQDRPERFDSTHHVL
ncbi:Glutathione transporter 1 [Sphaceloma murrayae]|uniref:Glutathione transporter 1 n=1 Tax=Sphaceloma murrayae TaxID=2082308 RepID=A0A2K1R1Y4_9PEZI|nr:Glutathione transporter 1 [Sphaceloma murrayae]